MSTNKQRRDNERLRLQRQLEQRREREVARRRVTTIASIVGALVLVAAVIVVVVVSTSGGDTKKTGTTAGGGNGTVTFQGVTVGNATNLKVAPKVTSKASADPTALAVKDLVVGTGALATPSSTVSVQYTGVLYKTGTQFDSSWSNGGQPISFSLAKVVAGFTQGIGGTSSISGMRVGGRRIMILPASLGYGPAAQGSIPANSPLVFVVDLTKVGS